MVRSIRQHVDGLLRKSVERWKAMMMKMFPGMPMMNIVECKVDRKTLSPSVTFMLKGSELDGLELKVLLQQLLPFKS